MFYAYGVLMQPMQDELGLSKPAVVGAYSVALLISGLLSTSAGSIIDRIGGRALMAGGSLLAALMLVCLSRVNNVVGLYLVWAGIGVAMSATCTSRRSPSSRRYSAATIAGRSRT
jgi:sugar phosphate permease